MRSLSGVKLLIVLIFLTAMVTWSTKTEFYPLSAWPMYAGNNRSGEIHHYKLLAHLQDGNVFRTDLRPIFGVLSQGRFMDHLTIPPDEQSPATVRRIRKLFQRYADLYDARHQNVNPIRGVEVQMWKWNLVKAPQDSRHGKMIQSRYYEVERHRQAVP